MRYLTMILLLITAINISNAQQTYSWDYYGLEIDVPADFKVVTNTDTEFEMKGRGMGMYMNIFEEDISVELMDEAVIETANALKMTEIDIEQVITGDGLDGYYVEGYKDGFRVVLAGMIDPKSHTNFFLLITYYDKDDVADEDALKIINSVRSKN